MKPCHLLLPPLSLRQQQHLPWPSPSFAQSKIPLGALLNPSMLNLSLKSTMAQGRAQLQSLSREPVFFL
uniref:Uncharacterized protein n=1 Tax=Lotus japonicus TaxID=34305 RepID=I3SAK2_LOTJA|nr:unknown [Lotus japonicus]